MTSEELREALGPEWPPFKTLTPSNAIIRRAARERLAQLEGGGREVWWCQLHDKEMATMSYCWTVLLDPNKLKAHDFCVRVRMQLLPLPDRGAE